MENAASNYDVLKDNELDYIRIKNGYFYFNYWYISIFNLAICN